MRGYPGLWLPRCDGYEDYYVDRTCIEASDELTACEYFYSQKARTATPNGVIRQLSSTDLERVFEGLYDYLGCCRIGTRRSKICASAGAQ